MKKLFGRLTGALLALAMTSTLAEAQSKVTIAIGGGACLCYLPTVLARQLGEYEKAGLAVDLVDLKGGSDALKAVPHWVNWKWEVRPGQSRPTKPPFNPSGFRASHSKPATWTAFALFLAALLSL